MPFESLCLPSSKPARRFSASYANGDRRCPTCLRRLPADAFTAKGKACRSCVRRRDAGRGPLVPDLLSLPTTKDTGED